MTQDRETLDCYNKMADEYADCISRAEPDQDLRDFMSALPDGQAPVLDWGCGPGNSSAIMMENGLSVEATDASPEMAKLATAAGVAVRIEPFNALNPMPRYRGIWANFSLLHLPRDAFFDMVQLASNALLPNGVLHMGMKTGTGQERDSLGRYYTYYSELELDKATQNAGLEKLSIRHGEGMGLAGVVAPFAIHLSRKQD